MADLDLDLFAPEQKTIKIGGQIISVEQPTTQQLFKLIKVGQEMQTIDADKVESVQEAMTKASELVVEIIPQLKEQPLNFAQILAVINLISEMAMPKQMTELEKRGITPAEAPKVEATS